MIDPTNALLESLDREPEKWQRTNGVVLFKAHRRAFPDGTIHDVTDHDLPRIARAANETIEASGRLSPLTLGHRNFGPGDESLQPDLLGFHKNFRTKNVTRNGETFLAVVADEFAAKDRATKYDLYRRYPFRSVEYSNGRGIAGVAALLQPPALDLGTVYHYSDDYRTYQGVPMTMTTTIDPFTFSAETHGRIKTYAAAEGLTYGEATAVVVKAGPALVEAEYDVESMKMVPLAVHEQIKKYQAEHFCSYGEAWTAVRFG